MAQPALQSRDTTAIDSMSLVYKAADIIAMLNVAGLTLERESGILGVCSSLLICRKAQAMAPTG